MSPTDAWSLRRLVASLPAIVLLGAFIRGIHVAAGADFPLNDGGMFFAMVEDVRSAGYALPEFSSYNGGSIPFAYPPLGFYAGSLISEIPGVSVLDVLRFLPLTASILTIVVFYLLARRLLAEETLALTATLLFAVVPRAFVWEIAGGGLTRSPGLLFALLAVYAGVRLMESRRWPHLLMTGGFAAITALSHPQMVWFVTYSLFVIALFEADVRGNLVSLARAGVFALFLSCPWWGTVLLTHGVGPFAAASQTGSLFSVETIRLIGLYDFTQEPFFPIVAALGLLGLVYCIGQKSYLLPMWLLAILVLDPRIGATLSCVVLSMTAALAIHRSVLPSLVNRSSSGPNEGTPPMTEPRTSVPAFVLSVVVIYGTIGGLMAGEDSAPLLNSLTPEARASMAWIEGNTPADSAFLIVTGEMWATDQASEWFPVLANRRSLATVQGTEWLADGAFARTEEAFEELQACAVEDVTCLEEWADTPDIGFSHIYVYVAKTPSGEPYFSWKGSPDCCTILLSSLAESPQYALVFENEDAAVFRHMASQSGEAAAQP